MRHPQLAGDVWRIVEVEAQSQSRQLTDSDEEYELLEDYIESGKPPIPRTGHHPLIASPFRYVTPTPPEYAARFKPPEGNLRAFYASFEATTVFYEAAYHWLRERAHIAGLSQTPEPRTIFSVSFAGKNVYDVSNAPDVSAIMSRRSYSASWEFVRNNPDATSIVFPSCRAPSRGMNLFTSDIETLGQTPHSYFELTFIYRADVKGCSIRSKQQNPMWQPLLIKWDEVS